ncbi:MAG: endonuclease/exonuclease/phosphatase family protein [Chloroflexota bacterium]
MTEIHVRPHRDEDSRPCPHLWSAMKRFLGWIGHGRLPGFAKVVMSVAEPAGRVTFQSEPRPAPDSAPAGECGPLTVVSANLWHDWPRHRDLERRLESFARLVESERVDLVLLQELARTPSLHADDWLARRLNMAYVYSRANGSEKIGFEEGLGVFCRFPLKRLPHLRQMGRSINPFVRRLALGVEVDTPCGEIMAFSTHLGLLRKQNAAQLRELHGWVTRITAGRSAIIAGDFNAPEHTHQIQRVRAYWQDAFREIYRHGHASTHEIRWPWGGAILSRRLDYIFLQPGHPAWQVVEVSHVDSPEGEHSDHRAVLARLSPAHGAV